MKKIPNTFKLGANTWKVEWSDTLLAEHKCYGITHYDTNTILLQRPIRGEYKMQNVKQVFWHGYHHAVFMTLNYLKLSSENEREREPHRILAISFTRLAELAKNSGNYELYRRLERLGYLEEVRRLFSKFDVTVR